MIMPPQLTAMKRWELQTKARSIDVELNKWRALSEAKQPLEKHYRQVRRLAKELDGMIKVIKREVTKLQNPTDSASFFREIRRVEYLILEVHRIWHFFRQKFAARQGPHNQLLEALDEFAWSCYSPVFTEKVPEPPLTFFSSDWSPAASFRHADLPIEQTVDMREGRTPQDPLFARKRLNKIVIPLISLPWFESTFLPEALFLAHETGHLLDNELELAKDYTASLKQASIANDRIENSWLSWSPEIFADLYAVLCLGPAFAGALMIRISSTTKDILDFSNDPSYPPPHVRMCIALEALKKIGFVDEAQSLKQTWNATYGRPVPEQPGVFAIQDYVQSELVDDVPAVVAAILDAPYTRLGSPLIQLDSIRWTCANQRLASTIASDLLSPGSPLSGGGPRELLAAAQLAFQQEPGTLFNTFANSKLATQDQLVEQILAQRKPGTRRGESEDDETPSPVLPDLDNLAASDEETGVSLAEALLAAFDAREARASTATAVEESNHG